MDADVIVVGGGINGLWTAYHLVCQGVKTMLLEQFPYPHTRGSSHGQSRITRTSYADEVYSAMMPEANRRWKELEKEMGRKLFVDMGLVSLYNVEENDTDFNSMLKNLKKFGIRHDIIPGEELEKRFPGFTSTAAHKGIFDAEAGLLRADNCLIALQDWYKQHGGILHDGELVVSLNPINEAKIEVKTSKRVYTCKSVVLTCGGYINNLLSTVDFRVPVQPVRTLVLYWKDKSGYKYSLSNKFPAVIVYARCTHLYSVPSYEHLYSIPSYEYPGLMKICFHGGHATDPNQRDQATEEVEANKKAMIDWVKNESKIFTDIDISSPMIEEVCMYTQSPDAKIILDTHPKHKNIIIGTGFSGMGFKTSPVIGLLLASMATGRATPYSLEPFSLKRFRTTSNL